MSNQNAAVELLQRELKECECRAAELRDAIEILRKTADSPRRQGGRYFAMEMDAERRQSSTKHIAIEVLRHFPQGMSTHRLWEAIEGNGGGVSNPNSLNAILNRHDDIFTRHPENPRHWILKGSGPRAGKLENK